MTPCLPTIRHGPVTRSSLSLFETVKVELRRRFAENEQYIVSSWLDDQGPKGFQFSSSSAVFGKERESSSLTHAARVWLEQDTENDASYYSAQVGLIKHLVLQLQRMHTSRTNFPMSYKLPNLQALFYCLFDYLFRKKSEFSCMSNLVGIKYVHPITINQYQSMHTVINLYILDLLSRQCSAHGYELVVTFYAQYVYVIHTITIHEIQTKKMKGWGLDDCNKQQFLAIERVSYPHLEGCVGKE